MATDSALPPPTFPLSASSLAKWTNFAMKGGIGKCKALVDREADSPNDLMMLEGDCVIALVAGPGKDEYLGYCEGVVGRFQAADVQFEAKLKKAVLVARPNPPFALSPTLPSTPQSESSDATIPGETLSASPHVTGASGPRTTPPLSPEVIASHGLGIDVATEPTWRSQRITPSPTERNRGPSSPETTPQLVPPSPSSSSTTSHQDSDADEARTPPARLVSKFSDASSLNDSHPNQRHVPFLSSSFSSTSSPTSKSSNASSAFDFPSRAAKGSDASFAADIERERRRQYVPGFGFLPEEDEEVTGRVVERRRPKLRTIHTGSWDGSLPEGQITPGEETELFNSILDSYRDSVSSLGSLSVSPVRTRKSSPLSPHRSEADLEGEAETEEDDTHLAYVPRAPQPNVASALRARLQSQASPMLDAFSRPRPAPAPPRTPDKLYADHRAMFFPKSDSFSSISLPSSSPDRSSSEDYRRQDHDVDQDITPGPIARRRLFQAYFSPPGKNRHGEDKPLRSRLVIGLPDSPVPVSPSRSSPASLTGSAHRTPPSGSTSLAWRAVDDVFHSPTSPSYPTTSSYPTSPPRSGTKAYYDDPDAPTELSSNWYPKLTTPTAEYGSGVLRTSPSTPSFFPSTLNSPSGVSTSFPNMPRSRSSGDIHAPPPAFPSPLGTTKLRKKPSLKILTGNRSVASSSSDLSHRGISTSKSSIDFLRSPTFVPSNPAVSGLYGAPISSKDFEEEKVRAGHTSFEMVKPLAALLLLSGGGAKDEETEGTIPSTPLTPSGTISTHSGGGDVLSSPGMRVDDDLEEGVGGEEQKASAESHRAREVAWIKVMAGAPLGAGGPRNKKLRALVQAGIPSSLRGKAWSWLADVRLDRKEGVYHALNLSDRLPIDDEIEADLQRCHIAYAQFAPDSTGRDDIGHVLKALARYEPSFGFAPGFGQVAAVLVAHVPAEEAFWLLLALIRRYGLNQCGIVSGAALQTESIAFGFLLEGNDARLSQHLITFDFGPECYLPSWKTTVFAAALPWSTRLRIFDLLFLDPKVFLRVSLAILELSRPTLLELHSRQAIASFFAALPSSGLTSALLLPTVFTTKLADDKVKKATKRAETLLRQVGK